MKLVETVGTDGALEIFRAYGVPMSYEKLTAWTDAGAVPWAVSARKADGHYLRTIFKRPLVEWLEGMAVDG